MSADANCHQERRDREHRDGPRASPSLRSISWRSWTRSLSVRFFVHPAARGAAEVPPWLSDIGKSCRGRKPPGFTARYQRRQVAADLAARRARLEPGATSNAE